MTSTTTTPTSSCSAGDGSCGADTDLAADGTITVIGRPGS